jgi:hypothetical protein
VKNIFDLYESEPGWKEATNDIQAVIKIAKRKVSEGEDPSVAYKEVSAVLRKYEPWGACDSEPEWAAAKMFCRGTDLDPSDFA